MRILQTRTNDEIEREFAILLQEGYGAGFLSHSQAIYMTPVFAARFGGALAGIGSYPEIIALRDRILAELGAPNAVGQDFAHMELFIAEFVLALTTEEGLRDVGDRTLECLDTIPGFRTLSLNALLGLSAMHLYQERYPPPPKEQAQVVAA